MKRLEGGSRHEIYRDGQVIRRPWQDWMPAVHSLLRHLEAENFRGAPRLVDEGMDGQGRAVWTYLEGSIQQPEPWPDEGIAELGALIREFHAAASTHQAPAYAEWQRWWIHDLRPNRGVGHGELAPWNILAVDGHPTALIDWEFAGPLDPVVDLAQAAWLNAQLHGDLVARLQRLPDADDRARQLRIFLDAYELDAARREGFVDLMIEVAVHSCAHEAHISGATPDIFEVGEGAWAMAWRASSAAWMMDHRELLQGAIL
jgi:aminoglycoside phosphotransferase (APT) family kinase protein